MTQLYVLLGVVIVPYHFLSFRSFWVEGELRKHYICILYTEFHYARGKIWQEPSRASTTPVYLHENLVLPQRHHS
jgi:hypothetical protein